MNTEVIQTAADNLVSEIPSQDVAAFQQLIQQYKNALGNSLIVILIPNANEQLQKFVHKIVTDLVAEYKSLHDKEEAYVNKVIESRVSDAQLAQAPQDQKAGQARWWGRRYGYYPYWGHRYWWPYWYSYWQPYYYWRYYPYWGGYTYVGKSKVGQAQQSVQEGLMQFAPYFDNMCISCEGDECDLNMKFKRSVFQHFQQ